MSNCVYIVVAVVYWTAAVVISGLIGWNALKIFSVTETNKPMLWQQRWTNFVGALTGWLLLWLLGLRYWDCMLQSGCLYEVRGLWDVVGGFFAFIGIAGYLPYTVIGFVNGVFETGKLIAARLAGALREK